MESKKPPAHSADFNFGSKELREARRAREPLRVGTPTPPAKSDDRGVDPYNTSGSFDRRKHWQRVGKR